MNPNFLDAASLPWAAVWPLLGFAVDGDVHLSHGPLASPFIGELQVFHFLLNAPLSPLFSVRVSRVAKSRPSVAASRTRRPLQIANTMVKDEQADYTQASPQVAATGKTFYDLKGCSTLLLPPLSLKNRQYSVFNLQNSLRTLDLPGWSIWNLYGAESNDRLNDDGTLPPFPLMPLRKVQKKKAQQSSCLLSSQICRGKRNSDLFALFQIQNKLISGKTLLQWVSSLDLVQDLKHALELSESSSICKSCQLSSALLNGSKLVKRKGKNAE